MSIVLWSNIVWRVEYRGVQHYFGNPSGGELEKGIAGEMMKSNYFLKTFGKNQQNLLMDWMCGMWEEEPKMSEVRDF